MEILEAMWRGINQQTANQQQYTPSPVRFPIYLGNRQAVSQSVRAQCQKPFQPQNNIADCRGESPGGFAASLSTHLCGAR